MQNASAASLGSLLERYRRGDPDAFRSFFARTSKLIYNFLLCKLRNQAEAEDVMQETYLRVHRYVGTYDEGRNALTWVMSIARNAMHDQLNRRRATHTMGGAEPYPVDRLVEPSPSPAEEYEFKQLLAAIGSELSTEEVDLLYERVFHQSSYEEIAAQRGLTVENARQKVSRLLKRIRSGLADT